MPSLGKNKTVSSVGPKRRQLALGFPTPPREFQENEEGGKEALHLMNPKMDMIVGSISNGVPCGFWVTSDRPESDSPRHEALSISPLRRMKGSMDGWVLSAASTS